MKKLIFTALIGATVLIITAIAILRSAWFGSYVRQSTVAAIERATGAHASLDNFSFSWAHLTATFDGLTLRGTEPVDGHPLFHAAHISLGLRSRFLLMGRIRLSTIDIDSPFVYLLERDDGTSNLPSLQAGPSVDVSDLIRLQASSVSIRNGTLQYNQFRTPIALDARDVDLSAQYRRRVRSYALHLGVSQIRLNVARLQQPPTALSVAGELSARQFAVQALTFQIGRSTINANGLVSSFSRPNVDLHASINADGRDVAQAGGLPWLKSAGVTVQGQFHYDPIAGAVFNGYAAGENVTYDRAGIKVKNGSFISRVFATPELIDVSELRLKALSGTVEGDLRFVKLRSMLFRGAVHGIDVRSFLLLLVQQPLPFSATVDGPVTLDTRLGNELTNTKVDADVRVDAYPDRPTVSGHVNVEYRQDGATVSFSSTKLQFDHATVDLSGELGSALQIRATANDIASLTPTLDWLGLTIPSTVQPGPGASEAVFNGEVRDALGKPSVKGSLEAQNFTSGGRHWRFAKSDFSASSSHLQLNSFSLTGDHEHASISGSADLRNWRVENTSALSLHGSLSSDDLGALGSDLFPLTHSLAAGAGAVSLNIEGTFQDLKGSGGIAARNVYAFGEKIDQIHAAVLFAGNQASITDAIVRSGSASATFQASYRHAQSDWANGILHVRADTNRFAIDTVAGIRRYLSGIAASAEIHAQGDFHVLNQHFQPIAIDGTMSLRDITTGTVRRGELTLNAGTQGDLLTLGLAGGLEGSPVSGNLRARLVGEENASGELHFGKVSLSTALALLNPTDSGRPGWDGFFSGNWTVAGPLLNLPAVHSTLTIDAVELRSSSPLPGGLSPNQFVLRNETPVVIETLGTTATIRHLQAVTQDTRASLAGSVDLASGRMDLHAAGSSDLRILQLVDPDLQTAGTAELALNIGGIRSRPNFRGVMQVKNASLILPDLTNGFTGINGTLRFDRNRAVLEGVTGQTGGGTVHLAGVVSLGGNQPITYNLDAQADHVRFRYLRASVTGDATLRMTGTTQNGLISGDVSLTRIVFEPGADLANVLANAAAPTATPVNEQDFLTGLGLDVHIQSSPTLQVLTSLSQNVQADIDLHLRGTRDHPAVLGHISANQGEVNVFGTRYTISRGNITFINAVRIEPVLDLDLQTETRGITVDVVVTGTLSKLSMSYRSDPPLQAKEIIALLTVGQTPTFASETSNSRVQADTTALQAGATTVLGQAISPASGRLSKLFGITNVRIDPFVQNLSNSRQARLTLEQQISRDITVTYVTNLAQTSEQIFRFEWAFNPQYSVVAVRDDNGEFGVDIQYKKRFK